MRTLHATLILTSKLSIAMQRYAPDTNFYIQFKSPQELSWTLLTREDCIELVILRSVLRELDVHKSGGNDRRASRARATLALIRPLITGEKTEVVLRERAPRVIYRIAPSSPVGQPLAPGLDTSTPDGRIVAEALACLASLGALTFLTHDTMAMLLAREAGLLWMELPEEWRLPPETAAKDKELQRLKAQLAERDKRVPDVAVQVIVGNAAVDDIQGSMPRYTLPDEAFLNEAMEAVMDWHPSATSKVSIVGLPLGAAQEDREAYEREYEQWRTDLRDQLSRYAHHLNAKHCSFPILLSLENQGSVSAEGLVVDVFAEGNIRLADPEALKKMAKTLTFSFKPPPKPPSYMSRFGGILASMSIDHEHLRVPDLRLPPPAHSRDFTWIFDKPNTASVHLEGSCGDFRHRIHQEEKSLLLTVPWDVRSNPHGRLIIRCSAKNLMRPIEFSWPIRLTYELRDAAVEIGKSLETTLGVSMD